MTLRLPHFSACLSAGIVIFCFGARSGAQINRPGLPGEAIPQRAGTVLEAESELPDAPQPQQQPAQTPTLPSNPDVAAPGQQQPSQPGTAPATQPAPGNPTQVPPPAPATPAPNAPVSSSSSSAQAPGQNGQPATVPANETPAEKKQREIAEQQLKQEEKQRIGVLPNFNASYISNAVSLSPGQKFRLMFDTEKDPATIGFSMFVALIGQAEGSHPAYGGGIGGYGKRFGQNYADTFDGAFWGNAVLPSLWHQDPRFFRLGQGPPMHRILYALSTNVRAKHDGTGKWEPNYSNLVGNLISGGISNLYLPANERGIGSTFEGAFLVTAEGGIGSMLEEFWPDFIGYLKNRKNKKAHPADVDTVSPKAPAVVKPGGASVGAPGPAPQAAPQPAPQPPPPPAPPNL